MTTLQKSGSGKRGAVTQLVQQWDSKSRFGPGKHTFSDLLEELLFHGDERFRDYRPHENEGHFAERLYNWLTNVPSARQRQLLLESLRWRPFIDDKQLRAMYRDAYLRCPVLWMVSMS